MLTYRFPLQFHDGVYLIFLLGLLEGFFVPLYQFYITPSSKEQKVRNVELCVWLISDQMVIKISWPFSVKYTGVAGMGQGSKCSPPTSVARVQFGLVPYVGWVCCWFLPCSEGFSPGFPVFLPSRKPTSLNSNFTLTAQILARSLANFYRQLADRHMNVEFMRCGNERERTIWEFVIVKKRMDVSF